MDSKQTQESFATGLQHSAHLSVPHALISENSPCSWRGN